MFPVTVFMTYKLTKLTTEWGSSSEKEEIPIIEEEASNETQEDAGFSEK